jgi:hypothetical protein
LGWILIRHEVLLNHILLPWPQRHYLTSSERFLCFCQATTKQTVHMFS